ncbi:MAG TPA: hypothetical protein VK699_20310 [Terriglobales bacterium]|jgi:hypothetical protein|nr:hypothetical protein [Terriglobales bacterium]
MKIHQAAVWSLALWLLVGSSVYMFAWQESVSKPAAGRPGVVRAQGVVNFSALAAQEALHPNKRVGVQEGPERETPRPQELPPGAIIKFARESNVTTPSAAPPIAPFSPLSPVLANNFLAELDNFTFIPPDTQGAVGPNHLVVTLNTNVVVQDRSGNNLTIVSLAGFWAPTGNSRTTDPRVVYDPFNDRWIISTSGDFELSTSGVLVGVSQTGDPTGNWNLYKVAVDSTNQHFCDFPTLGFNNTWIVVMCNVFANASNSNFFAGNIYAFDKFNLYSHGNGAHTVLDTGGDSNVTPAITYDNNLATEYLVEEYNGNMNGVGMMRLWAINGPVGSPTLSTVAFPSTLLNWDEQGTANFAPQLGSTTGIDTGDARIGNVIYRNGTLWTAHPIYLPCCASSTPAHPPTRSAIQWWQLDTSGDVLQRGLIDNPDGSYFRSYPSIAVNQYNDALIGYARFSPNEFAGGFYSFHASSDPPNTLEGETTLRAGEATYVDEGTGGGTSNRWGDYSNTVVDPIDDTSFWSIQEYAASPSSTWGTWWGQIVQPPASFQISFTPSSTTLTAGVALADLAVTALDVQGHPVGNYRGTVHFTSSDPLFTMADYTFSAADAGTHHFSGVTLFKAGAQSISLTDAANSLQNTLNFTVVPGPVNSFTFDAPNTAIHGIPFNFTVTAKDAFQNLVVNYSGTVQFSSTDSSAILPVNYQFNPGSDQGVHTFPATLRQAGPQNVSVADVASMGNVHNSFAINVIGPATHLNLVAPLSVTRTRSFTVTVTALDSLNQVDPVYAGTIHFTTSDTSFLQLPPDYTFMVGDHGNHYFLNGVTLSTLGTQTVTATDTPDSITGSVSINVVDLSGTARSLRVRLGQPFNNLIVANFSDDNPGTLSASIDWGDGATTSSAPIQLDGLGGYVVLGSHAYVAPPEHPATITISDSAGYPSITLTDSVRMWPKTESH